MTEDTLNQERRLNREMRNRIGEVFGELAWEVQQLFSEKPEQVDDINVYHFDRHVNWSVKM